MLKRRLEATSDSGLVKLVKKGRLCGHLNKKLSKLGKTYAHKCSDCGMHLCVECEDAVFEKPCPKGLMTPHFSHYSKSACSGGGGEGVLHKTAKNELNRFINSNNALEIRQKCCMCLDEAVITIPSTATSLVEQKDEGDGKGVIDILCRAKKDEETIPQLKTLLDFSLYKKPEPDTWILRKYDREHLRYSLSVFGIEIMSTHKTDTPRNVEWCELVAKEVLDKIFSYERGDLDTSSTLSLECVRYKNGTGNNCEFKCSKCSMAELVKLWRLCPPDLKFTKYTFPRHGEGSDSFEFCRLCFSDWAQWKIQGNFLDQTPEEHQGNYDEDPSGDVVSFCRDCVCKLHGAESDEIVVLGCKFLVENSWKVN
jgi:hypothetical protein